MHEHSADYQRVASVYDGLAALYSGGGIRRAKLAHLTWVEPGQRILYVGSGTGLEAVAARSQGAEVTLLDTSSAMLDRAQHRFERDGLAVGAPGVELRLEALEAHTPARPYDVVVASFFLNVYGQSSLSGAIARLGELVRPGGRLVVADFAAPSAARTLRAVQRAYYVPPLVLFRVLTQNPWHELYDYARALEAFGSHFGPPERRSVRAFGLPLFEAIAWQRVSGAPLLPLALGDAR
jgi:demethylmenaquinone methyltransferase/2-methoxy-6-polyprenyl-1,4-benzoquinol methylase